MQVRVHPREYLDGCGDKQRLKDGLAKLGEDPFTSRSGLDIKKLKEGRMRSIACVSGSTGSSILWRMGSSGSRTRFAGSGATLK